MTVDVSQFSETEALQKAGIRINHVVDQIKVLESAPIPWPLPAGVEYSQVSLLATQVADFRKRVTDYAQTIANALPSTSRQLLLTIGTAGLYAVGVGLSRVLGGGVGPTGIAGTDVLQQVLAYEAEAASLGQQLGALTGTMLPGAAALPDPVKGVEDSIGSTFESLAMWVVIGLGVYFGGKWLLAKLDNSRAGQLRKVRGDWPDYA